MKTKNIFLAVCILTSAICYLTSYMASAQAPQAFKYQSIVRDAAGNPMASSAISVRASVHNGAAAGPIVYQETHAVTTNSFGLINLEIGMGTIVSGTFSSIAWGTGTKWMQIEADFGAGYLPMGTSQLLSVPYALNALNGPVGPAGPAGANGATGPAGPAGANGPQGPTGPAGANGATGPAGVTGANGATGATGAAGTNGTNGATGATGAQGATGATGVVAATFNLVNNAFASWLIGNTTDYVSLNNSNPTLTLERGLTYIFDIQVSGHPFRISASGVWLGAPFNTGVTNQDAQSSQLTFKVPMDAPNTLYYMCVMHSAMIGTLNIVNPSVGPTGPTGPTGAAGTNGATGPTGAAGTNGATGATGAAGATGATGPAGSISGSGTLNYVPKFTPNGTTLGNSLMFDNGTNVGIGTITPTQKLHVSDILARIDLQSTTNGNNAGYRMKVQDAIAGSEILGIYGVPANPANQRYITFAADDITPHMIIRADGNVGIGTTSPQRSLHVSNTTIDEQLRIGTGVRDLILEGHTVAGIGQWTGMQNDGAGGNKVWLGSGSFPSKLFVAADGKVSMGTSSPTTQLHVMAAADPLQIMVENIGGNFKTGYRVKTALQDWFIGQESTSMTGFRIVDVTQANAVRLQIAPTTGYVGIGTPSPTSMLQVVGLPLYADNLAATAAGLTIGAFYRTATGVVMVVY